MVQRRAGKRVAALRKRLGLSLAGMGAKLGVSDVTVLRWERGDHEVNECTALVLDAIEREIEFGPNVLGPPWAASVGPVISSTSETYILAGEVYHVPVNDSPVSKIVRAVLEANGAVKTGPPARR